MIPPDLSQRNRAWLVARFLSVPGTHCQPISNFRLVFTIPEIPCQTEHHIPGAFETPLIRFVGVVFPALSRPPRAVEPVCVRAMFFFDRARCPVNRFHQYPKLLLCDQRDSCFVGDEGVFEWFATRLIGRMRRCAIYRIAMVVVGRVRAVAKRPSRAGWTSMRVVSLCRLKHARMAGRSRIQAGVVLVLGEARAHADGRCRLEFGSDKISQPHGSFVPDERNVNRSGHLCAAFTNTFTLCLWQLLKGSNQTIRTYTPPHEN